MSFFSNKKENSFNPKTQNRVALVDNVKGLLVVIFLLSQLMIQINGTVGGNTLKTALNFPVWFWHGADVSDVPFWNFFGFSFLDLGPISFFYVIAVVMFFSFEKRLSVEKKSAVLRRFFMRNGTIVGLFLPLNIIASMFLVRAGGLSSSWNWGTIPSIGFTGLILTPFVAVGLIRRHWWAKTAAGAGVLLFYYYCFDFIRAFDGTEGGPAACIGYAAVVLLAGALGDLQRKGTLWYALGSVVLFLFGVWLKSPNVWGAAVYDDYNATYMILALNLVNAFYFVFYIIDKLLLKGRSIPVLAAMGRNILLYFILTGCVINPLISILPFFKSITPPTLFLTQGICLLLYIALAVFLEKKKIVFKL
ncbi:MAG: hypothetical protein LBP62_06920 [Clostridiales bacterium]|nr:hypothetical protein [Clostridiales bacterium]